MELLDVSRNQLTEAGIGVLQATGVPLLCQLQHGGNPEYLREGDYE